MFLYKEGEKIIMGYYLTKCLVRNKASGIYYHYLFLLDNILKQFSLIPIYYCHADIGNLGPVFHFLKPLD